MRLFKLKMRFKAQKLAHKTGHMRCLFNDEYKKDAVSKDTASFCCLKI